MAGMPINIQSAALIATLVFSRTPNALRLLRLGNSYDCCARLTLILGTRWQNTSRLAISSDHPHSASDEKPSGSASDSLWILKPSDIELFLQSCVCGVKDYVHGINDA
jgi:hypothetical protein